MFGLITVHQMNSFKSFMNSSRTLQKVICNTYQNHRSKRLAKILKNVGNLQSINSFVFIKCACSTVFYGVYFQCFKL